MSAMCNWASAQRVPQQVEVPPKPIEIRRLRSEVAEPAGDASAVDEVFKAAMPVRGSGT